MRVAIASTINKHVCTSEHSSLFANNYVHDFTHLCTNISRYVKQCELFLLDGRISCEMFASECLPTLIHLARDKVPNVRIAVARMLKDSVLSIGRVLFGCVCV